MSHKTKIAGIISAIFLLIGLGFTAFKGMSNWYNTHEIVFNKILTMEWKKPVEIKDRKLEITEIINIVNQIPTLDNLTPIEQYICEKWGIYDCKTALAIAKSESGVREDAWNVNTNGSIDVGIYQINSVHFKKEGCSLKELVDQYKNVDCAYKIYEASGWSPWVVFKTGVFKDKL